MFSVTNTYYIAESFIIIVIITTFIIINLIVYIIASIIISLSICLLLILKEKYVVYSILCIGPFCTLYNVLYVDYRTFCLL